MVKSLFSELLLILKAKKSTVSLTSKLSLLDMAVMHSFKHPFSEGFLHFVPGVVMDWH